MRTAEQLHKDLLDAQAKHEDAKNLLTGLHDAGADDEEIGKQEARVFAADTLLARAQMALEAHGRREAAAAKKVDEKRKAEIRKQVAKAITIREQSARRIDELAREIAECKQTIDEQDEVIRVAVRDGALQADAGTAVNCAARAVELALGKANVITVSWIGDRARMPDAYETVTRLHGVLEVAA